MKRILELPLNVIQLIKEFLPYENYNIREALRLYIYRETHREILKERFKHQYVKNRIINIKCECGGEFKKVSLNHHIRTKKHLI